MSDLGVAPHPYHNHQMSVVPIMLSMENNRDCLLKARISTKLVMASPGYLAMALFCWLEKCWKHNIIEYHHKEQQTHTHTHVSIYILHMYTYHIYIHMYAYTLVTQGSMQSVDSEPITMLDA